jgi:hypothetical protein
MPLFQNNTLKRSAGTLSSAEAAGRCGVDAFRGAQPESLWLRKCVNVITVREVGRAAST